MSSKSTLLGPKGREFLSFNKDFISWTFGGIWNPLAGGQNSMKMAWNISIHTKESMTFDSLLILLSTSFGRMYHTYHVIRVVDQTPRKGKYGSATAMELCYLHSTFIHVDLLSSTVIYFDPFSSLPWSVSDLQIVDLKGTRRWIEISDRKSAIDLRC